MRWPRGVGLVPKKTSRRFGPSDPENHSANSYNYDSTSIQRAYDGVRPFINGYSGHTDVT